MEHVEIERRFLIKDLPSDLDSYPSKSFEQGYLSINPVLRVRREEDDYFVTYKGRGKLLREEYNLPLTEEAYEHLISKADGTVIKKRRYFIPLDNDLVIELDIFEGNLSPLKIAEVEFSSEEEAMAFEPPDWFGREVTDEEKYSNSSLSRCGLPEDMQR